MLISLVKKDFILVKKELLILFIAAVGVPVYVTIQLGPSAGKAVGFFISALFIEYLLFSSVSTSEFKYKGSSLLCATPYARDTMVKAKYLFLMINFACVFIIYVGTALLTNIGMTLLNIYDFGICFLLIAAFFGIVIPFQYKFGFQKTKYITLFIVFITPFSVPFLVKWIHENNINLSFSFPFSKMILGLMLCLLALLIGYISMIISINIYSKKNL